MSATPGPEQPPRGDAPGALQKTLDSLTSFLQSGAVYHSGTLALPQTGISLFYASQKGNGTLHVPGASGADIERLVQACDPATFGLNQEDVLDEGYRKAWKLDTTYFASQFALPHTFCADVVELMLGAFAAEFTLEFELYKLNVYGPGSFFEAHVDTPRQPNMIGSLVIVLPTEHKGGGLTLRHRGVERTVNSAEMVSLDPSAPLAAFAVFYGDVEHEVLPVTSGYRLTLTYNVYKTTNLHSLIPDPLTSTASRRLADEEDEEMDEDDDSEDDKEHKKNSKDDKTKNQDDENNDNAFTERAGGVGIETLKADVLALLHHRRFLPKGGFLAFHLAHKCVMKTSSFWGKLNDHVASLKGVDALLYHVLQDVLSLECSLQLLSEFEEEILVPGSSPGWRDVKYHTLSAYSPVVGGEMEDDLSDRVGGTYVWDSGSGVDAIPYVQKNETFAPVVWVGKSNPLNETQEDFISYGNEATTDSIYQKVCLVVKIDSFVDRARV